MIQAEVGCDDREQGMQEEREEDRRKIETRRVDSLISRQNINRFQSLPNLIPPYITPFIS
jgi:hypothetical protein